MTALVFNLSPTFDLTDQQFYRLCQTNPDLQLETTAEGALLIMPPTGGNTGRRNFNLTSQFGGWVERSRLGVGFDSSTVFKLPNGARRSPDVAWVLKERWDALTPEQQDLFPPIAPDFVMELRSRTDTLETLQQKMQEYRENGVRLGWLIDPQTQDVYFYRPEHDVEVLHAPMTLSAEDLLPGFILNLQPIWS